MEHWQNLTKSQSKLVNYLAKYKLEDYVFTVRYKTEADLTKYRLSDHSLAIEKGKEKKNHGCQWSKEYVVGHCMTGEVETEVHFLLHCEKYENIQDTHFYRFVRLLPGF